VHGFNGFLFTFKNVSIVEKSLRLQYNKDMVEIDKINDKLFKDALQKPENARIFLKAVLPEEIKKRIDFSIIEIGPTNYVSKEFKEYFSDIVVKTKMVARDGGRISTDVCFILEHKTKGKNKIFLQFLKYMVQEWQKDIDKSKPLRIIIPVVFYHGKEPWKVPHTFIDHFDVDDELKEYLLNYRYILFDTRQWDFRDEKNEELKNNVFLLTAMALMKSAYRDDSETIGQIFNFWHEKGFTEDIENVIFFLTYISGTKELEPDQLKKMLEKSKIEGGEIMATLAQRWLEQGKKIGLEEGIEKGIEKGIEQGIEKGIEKGKLETARELIKRGVDINIITEATGIPREEIEKLASTIH
jgi:predicted transposase/invertase (TIGR01784 family)